INANSFSIRIAAFGYEQFTAAYTFAEKEKHKRLGAIRLKLSSRTLKEVVIKAKVSPVKFMQDTVEYNATAFSVRDGDNIADLLNVLPSDAIEKIEVMTNPPAKYSADGEGIINIVMKKGFKVGFNGNVGFTAGTQGNTNTNANASYRGEKYSITGGGAYRMGIGKSISESYRTNFFPDTTFYYNQFNNARSDSDGGNFRVAMDWDINKKQSLRLNTSYNINGSESLSGNDFYYINEEEITKRLRNQVNLGDNNSKNFVFNADYSLNTDTVGGRLTAGFTVNASNSNSLRSFERTYAFPTNLNPSLQQNENETGNSGFNFNLDYDKPVFNKRDRLEFGIAYNYRKNNNDLTVDNFNYNTAQYVNNTKLSNEFLYNENILAGYVSYNYRKEGWSAKAALRSEYTNVNFDLSSGEVYNVNPYLSVFPSLSLNRFFKKKYNIGATYSVRINRPRENTLNPQINNADTLNISYGNAELSPSYTHQFDVSFGAFGQKWSFTPRISYSTASGVIERYRFVNPNGISESTFSNVGNNYSLALMLIGNYRPTKKLSTNGNFSVIQSRYNSTLNSALNRGGISIRSRAGFSMQLPYKTAFEANLNYNNNVSAIGRNRASVNTSFGARKTFFKNT
ncbi:MAG: TonB-dependent receptor, partial [Chitinophagaceae bacterium]